MAYKDSDDVLDGVARGDFPATVKAVDMRDALFGIVQHADGSVDVQARISRDALARHLRRIADALEAGDDEG